jgi:1-acyl-sn-glycerol-3-phosphate acyltransferase
MTYQRPLRSSGTYKQVHQIGVDVLAEAFRVQQPLLRVGLNLMMRSPAHDLARTALQFDARVAEHNTMREASRWLIENWASSIMVRGAERIPAVGPLIIVSNHPGMLDAMAIMGSLPRTDVRPIAKTRNLLQQLHHVQEQIILVREEETISTLRYTLRYLKDGGAVLTFPRGAIEPDPVLYPEAAQDILGQWSDSLDLLVRRTPGAVVVPVAVGGVISQAARKHPLARMYRQRDVRDYMAATLQIIMPRYRGTDVRVMFGEPLRGDAATATNACASVAKLLRSVV